MPAVCSVMMFGPSVSENITLDMQEVAPTAVPTRLGMWLVIINPLTKLALTLTPVAMAFEVRELPHLVHTLAIMRCEADNMDGLPEFSS